MKNDLTHNEFIEELAELETQLKAEIEAYAIGLDAREPARARRRSRVLKDGDFRFFAYTYFPHHVRGAPSTFQDAFCDDFPKLLLSGAPCRDWWVAPRGECKSSLLTKIGVVFLHVMALLQDKQVRAEVGVRKKPPFLDYATILGAELRQPTKLLEVGKIELTSNGALEMDFPEACGKGDIWKVGEYVSRSGVKVEPFGAEQAIRGTFFGASRPQVLFGDDLITDSEAKSPTERENRWNWVERAIDYLGPPDGSVKFLSVGTILNADDPISRAKITIGHRVHHYKAIEKMPVAMNRWERCEEIMRNQDRRAKSRDVEKLPSYRYYLGHKKAMDAGARTSWPSVRSLYWLMTQRAKNRKAFATKMQGEPRTDEDMVFDVDAVKFWVHPRHHWKWYAGCDPSLGRTVHSHPSAIVVGAWCTETLKAHIEVAESKRRVPTKLSADLIGYQETYPIIIWGFENNGAFEHSRQTFITDAARKKVHLPLRGITATSQTGLEVWVDSLEPPFNDGRIELKASLASLMDHLRDWPNPQPDHHFDLLVALYLFWLVASAGAGGIPKIATSHGRRSARYVGYD